MRICCGAHNARAEPVCQVRHGGAGGPVDLPIADAVAQLTSHFPLCLTAEFAEVFPFQLKQSQTSSIPAAPPIKQPAPKPDDQKSADRRREPRRCPPAYNWRREIDDCLDRHKCSLQLGPGAALGRCRLSWPGGCGYARLGIAYRSGRQDDLHADVGRAGALVNQGRRRHVLDGRAGRIEDCNFLVGRATGFLAADQLGQLGIDL